MHHYLVYGDDSANSSYLAQALLDVPDHVAIVVVVLYVMYRDGRPWSEFGITRSQWLRDPLEAFAVLITTYFVIGRIYGFSGMVIGVDAIKRFSESTYEFATPVTSLEIVVLLLISMSIGLSEEIAMRGYLLPTFERLLNSTPLSVFLTSVIFASYHIYQGFGATVWIFVAGLVFGTIFAVWRRLWPLVLAHAANDVVAALWPS